MNPTIKNHSEKVIGYKAVKKDKNGYYTDGFGCAKKHYFKLGEIYEIDGNPELCNKGFHFFRHYCFAIDYLHTNNAILKVESFGDVQEDSEKCVTNKLKILELDYEELLEDKHNSGDYNSGNRNSGHFNSGNRNSGNRNSGDCNSGDFNSGDYNSGDYNSGYYNPGNRNSGDCNSGDYNSGDYNSGDYNSGYYNSGHFNSGYFNSAHGYINHFCTDTKYFLFDIECSKEEAEKVCCLDMSWFNLESTYKEAWKNCPKKVLAEIKKLKHFNKYKFFEITGINID